MPWTPPTIIPGVTRYREVLLAQSEGISEAHSRIDELDQTAPVDSTSSLLQGLYAGWSLYGSGNSYMDNSYFFDRLAPRFGFESQHNLATGGYRVQDVAISLNQGSLKWTPSNDPNRLVIVNCEGNNMADTDDAANRGAAINSARTIAALLSSKQKIETTDSSVFSFGSDWIAGGDLGNPVASQGTLAASNFEGSWVDVTVPAGDSYLLCYGGNGTDIVGGKFTVTQGDKTFEIDLNNVAKNTPYLTNTSIAPAVLRLSGMEAGVARATFSRAGRDGNVIGAIDGLLIPADNPPAIVWLRPVPVRDANYQKPSLFAYLRSIGFSIASEFDNVTVIDPAAGGWNPETMIGEDDLHPNSEGVDHLEKIVIGGLIRAAK